MPPPRQPDTTPVGRDTTHPSDGLPDLAVVDRAAIKKIGIVAIVAIVGAVIAAVAIAVVLAYSRIHVLEGDLRERRAVRDREAAEVQRQQEEARQIICTALDHLNDPQAPELDAIRVKYHCPSQENTP